MLHDFNIERGVQLNIKSCTHHTLYDRRQEAQYEKSKEEKQKKTAYACSDNDVTSLALLCDADSVCE